MIAQERNETTMLQDSKIILYGHFFCPMVPPTLALLKRAQADFVYIDVMRDEVAMQHLITLNNGYASVPTLVFPDGSKLTEPHGGELRAKLEMLGYEIPPPRWLQILRRWFG